jgi:tRNA uridine 5-carboxymethylaminomethyl modification enzyme
LQGRVVTDEYDVVVIGGGHAGIEASIASAKMGAKTALVTMLVEQIGACSCNPAVGGLGKGHLVKELDALGGVMGQIADISAIQFKVLNGSKGPAVRGSRVQIDMDIYRQKARELCLNQNSLTVIQDTVLSLIIKNKSVVGIKTDLGKIYKSKKIIITTGTFLNGLIHIGEFKKKAGRFGEFSSTSLADNLKDIGFEIGRLKTGTTPRLDAKSINFDKLELHGGDDITKPFSFKSDNKKFCQTQIPCYIAYTNENTHKLIEQNFDKAPLFSGQIEGVGPRYCPSIEDKISRFRDRTRHQLFVEPQTIEATEYYINGLSTSLPTDIQDKIIANIKGLENAKIVRYGYAIEYDYVQPTELKHTLETKKLDNLYFAGQINGTTGYEEAAAQGFMASVNAILSIQKKEPFILRRDEAYIGVLIDDLVTKGTNEPYRMFTSRAEYRLLLREDNALFRLSSYGYNMGLITKEQYSKIEETKAELNRAFLYLKNNYATPNKEFISKLASIDEEKITDKTLLCDIVSRSTFTKDKLLIFDEYFKEFNANILDMIVITARYYRYIDKQQKQIDKMKLAQTKKIPQDFIFKTVPGLSGEAVEKLGKLSPPTLFEASNISGVSPADIDVLSLYIELRTKRA